MMRQRPIVRTRNPIRVMRRRRRWDRISWWYSAILVVPILLILGDWLFGIGPDDDNGSSAKTIAAITVNVTDASTTQPIAGAFVGAGDVTASTNQDGEATINIPDGVSVVTVSSAGYQSVYGAIDGTTGAQQDVALKPSGTGESARQLGVDEHAVVKTLVMEDDKAKPLIVLMHGDRTVSTKNLARQIGAKRVEPCKPEVAQRHSGYMVGGTSPFGTKRAMVVYVEASVLDLPKIFINGGRRGYLIGIAPQVLLNALGAKPVNCALSDD